MIREARRLRKFYKARGVSIGPPPTKEQVVALATWAIQREKTAIPAGMSGLGQATEGAVSGAMTGASVGITLGPVGAAVGALVGGAAGAFMGKSQAKKAATSAKQAEKIAKTQLKAAQTSAVGQVQSATLVLEAEKVKSGALEKVPKWLWIVIGGAGVATVAGGVVYGLRKRGSR